MPLQQPTSALLSPREGVISFSRDMGVAGGNVSYAGLGFTPAHIHIIASGLDTVHSIRCHSEGYCGVVGTDFCLYWNGASWNAWSEPGGVFGKLVVHSDNVTYTISAILASYNADGFTLTWARSDGPAGILNCTAYCYV